jgi:hypothetical protein
VQGVLDGQRPGQAGEVEAVAPQRDPAGALALEQVDPGDDEQRQERRDRRDLVGERVLRHQVHPARGVEQQQHPGDHPGAAGESVQRRRWHGQPPDVVSQCRRR